MAWGTPVSATNLTFTAETNEKVFQISAADMEVEIAPNEIMQLFVKADRTSGTTGDMVARVYTSNVANPGAVPDSSQTLAGSDWALYTAWRIPGSDRDNEWQNISLKGIRWVSVTMEPTSTSDNWTGYLTYNIGS